MPEVVKIGKHKAKYVSVVEIRGYKLHAHRTVGDPAGKIAHDAGWQLSYEGVPVTTDVDAGSKDQMLRTFNRLLAEQLPEDAELAVKMTAVVRDNIQEWGLKITEHPAMTDAG